MTRFQKIIFWFLFALLLAALIYIQYYGLVRFKYPVPPGDDPASHYQMAKQFYDGKSSIFGSWRIGGYPPGYHLLVAKTAHLLNANPLQIILWTYPAVFIVAGLAIFATTYGLFGPWAGFFSFLVYSFATRSTIQLLNDGSYPNLLASHALLPLFFLFVVKFLQKKKIIYLLLGLLFALLIAFTHHATTLVLLVILTAILPVFIIGYAFRKQWTLSKVLFLLIESLAVFILLFITIMKSELFAPAKSLLNSTLGVTSAFPFINFAAKADRDAIWKIVNYPSQIGPVATYFGLVGLVGLILVTFIKRKQIYYFPIIILTVWILLLFLGSRMIFLSNPERLGRDLAVPVSIVIGGFIAIFISQFKTYWVKAFLVISSFIFIGWNVPERINSALAYQPMVRVTPADLEAIEFLTSNKADWVLVRDFNYYLPILMPETQFIYYSNDDIDKNDILKYNYAYIITRQGGWAPEGYQEGVLQNYFSEEIIEDYFTFSSDTKEITLVKILR